MQQEQLDTGKTIRQITKLFGETERLNDKIDSLEVRLQEALYIIQELQNERAENKN